MIRYCRHLVCLWLFCQLTACTLAPPHSGLPSSEYEQQIVSNAEAAAHENHWAAAFKMYQQALKSFPDSLVLQQAHNALLQRHAAQLGKLEQERLIAQGEWLLKDLAISQLTNNESASNWFAAHPDTQKHQQASELAEQLALLGQQALAQNDVDLATRTLPLAWKLAPTASHEAFLEQLRRVIKPHDQPATATPSTPTPSAPTPTLSAPTPLLAPLSKQMEAPPPETDKSATPIAAELNHQQKPGKRLLVDFNRALKNESFNEARQLLEKLPNQGIDKTTIANLHKQLNDSIAGQVKNLMAAGVNDYSQQHYEAALKSWQRAQILAPDNAQLTAHIERVSKILEKLQGLRNKQLKSPGKTDKIP